jgi:tryptophan aminotransferase
VFKRKMLKYMVGEDGERLAEWTTPEAGMFFWYTGRNHYSVLPRYSRTGTDNRFKLVLPAAAADSGGVSGPTRERDDGDSERLVRTRALEKGVLALPGTVFLPSGRKTGYVRAAFSLLEEGEVDEAVRRLRDAVIEARGEIAA